MLASLLCLARATSTLASWSSPGTLCLQTPSQVTPIQNHFRFLNQCDLLTEAFLAPTPSHLHYSYLFSSFAFYPDYLTQFHIMLLIYVYIFCFPFPQHSPRMSVSLCTFVHLVFPLLLQHIQATCTTSFFAQKTKLVIHCFAQTSAHYLYDICICCTFAQFLLNLRMNLLLQNYRKFGIKCK